MVAKTLLLALAGLLFVAPQGGQTFEFRLCDRGASTLHSIVISACPEASGAYCEIKRGTNVSLAMNFTPHYGYERAELVLEMRHGQAFERVSSVSACTAGLPCPGAANQLVKFAAAGEIPKTFPLTRTPYRLDFLDELHRQIFCVEFPVKILR